MPASTPVRSTGRRQWLALIRRSLSGDTADATRGRLPETLTLLAVPMALEMALEGVFAVTDIVFVARLAKRPSPPSGSPKRC
jgi:hypothetical protein